MMEALALYLLKSAAWISGFALVYFLFLKNERFFTLNRFFLVGGIFTSLIFPFITVRYVVMLPAAFSEKVSGEVMSGLQEAGATGINVAGLLLLCLYLAGSAYVIFRYVSQVRSVFGAIKKAEVISTNPVKLIRSADCVTPFSFLSYVVVNPSITDMETQEIVNHEMVHIRQKHWFDLLLSGALCIVQWFNPVIWIYSRFIRQNHEYLADRVALQRTSDPAFYMAALLNQLFGSPVIDLGNYFNYSLNKKRFTMMKNINTSPYRKLRVFLVLPVFALVLFAFAKPDYRTVSDEINPAMTEKVLPAVIKEVKGTVVTEDGKPLAGAAVIIKGTTMGTVTDEKGSFKLSDVPEDGLLVISYVGFESKVMKPVFGSGMTIKMKEG
ncbi:MAG: carboxypeptidase-like regulatory domain-containing protein, partial [Bacteroidales bacterium]|nr:carboxypeptidase-like regulatory domain-containing protein [Bacteroidales bacterium]